MPTRPRFHLASLRLLHAVLICLFLPAPSALAAGRIEINQTAALAGGVTASDAPGFPVTIDAPGSYVLTGDLSLAAESPATDAIEIVVPLPTQNVTLDLAGFEIAGPATCTGFADGLICSNTGPGVGIEAAGASEVVIRDGMIRNMGSHGVDVWGAGRVTGLTVKHNGGDGVRLGFGSSAADVIARDNAGDGVSVGDGSLARDSVGIGNAGRGLVLGLGASGRQLTARDNGGHGVELGVRTTATGVAVSQNRAMGLVANGQNAVRDVAASSNSGVGIWLNGGRLEDATAWGNGGHGIQIGVGTIDGCESYLNTSRQIDAGNGAVVTNCFVRVNGDTGIFVSIDSRIVGNHVTGVSTTDLSRGIRVNGSRNVVEDNTISRVAIGIDVVSGDNAILDNRVNASGTAYDFVAGNAVGPVVDLTGGGELPEATTAPNLEW